MFLSYLVTFFLSLQFVVNWCLHKTTGFAAIIENIEYSPDRSLFLTTNDQGTAHLWSATNFLIVNKITPPSGSATSARFNKNNTLFAVSTSTSMVYLYNMTSPYSQITSYNPGIGSANTAIDFSYDGQFLLICGGNTNTAKIINLLTGAISSTFAFSSATTCKFAQNSNIGIAGTALSYVLTAGTNVWSQAYPGCLQLNIDGTSSYMVMSCNNGGSKAGYMINTATQAITTVYSSSGLMRTAQISPDSEYVVFSGDDKKVVIKKKSGATLSVNYTFIIESEAYSSDFSSDSNYFLIGTKAGYIYEYSKYCLDCQAGSYQNLTTLKCQNCSQYIRACGICINSTYCIQCNQGYYLQRITVPFTTNRICLPCLLEGCIVCTDSVTCLRCQVGYYVNSGLCKVCTSGGTGMIGCLRCNSSSICQQCSHDYYLSSNKCNLCNSIVGCSLCSSSAYCHVCQVGYYFNSGICTACPTNCLACFSTTTCQDCRQGYYPTNTVAATCSRCPTTGCLSCNETGYCLQCISGRYYNSATGTCPTCSYPCNQCNSTVCFNCQPGFYLDYAALNFTSNSSGGVCVQCNHPCVTCSSSSACLTCPIGFYLVSATKVCQTCQILQSFCSQCSSTTCLSCTLGYYLNSSNLCTPCTNNMHACISCTNISTCVQCTVGFYLTASTGNNSCASCPQGCQLCNSTAYCYGCIDGFYRDGNTCRRCAPPCTLCSSSSICLQCEEEYYLSGTTCIGCIQNITNCLTCDDQTGTIKCTSCKTTYYLNLGTCVSCAAPCLTCLSSSTCTQCDIGFYIVGVSCSQCPQNCSACSSPTNCSSCNIGFYFNSTDRKCYHCTNLGCLTCNSSYSCLSCSPGSYLTVNNTCSLCHSSMKYCQLCSNSTNCQSCSFGYVLNSNSTGCVICSTINGCFDCSSLTSCDACQPGYYLYNNSGSITCNLCPPTCLTCTSQSSCLTCLPGYKIQGTSCSSCQQAYIGCQICNGTKCQQCMNGYYLNPSGFCNLCRSSMKGCQYCNSSSICTYCALGFYLQPGNTCQLCSVPMLACQVCSSSSLCVQCENGYFLQSGNCILCRSSMPGCLKCTDNNTCLQCYEGYTLNLTNLECSLCKNSMSGCISCLTVSTCQQCEAGYYLRSSDTLCIPCNQTGCQICYQSNPNSCISCNTMYFLLSSRCHYCGQYIQGCIQCTSNSVCTLCETGYFLNSTNKCQLCQTTIEGCSKCQDSFTCYQCKSTYLINSTSSKCQTCLSAIQGCAYCLDLTSCISCSNGFYKNSSGFCQLCSTINGCLACKDSNTCLLCSANYYLQTSGNCRPCDIIVGCYSCTNNLTCLVCSGGYILNDDKICEIYQAQGGNKIKGMKMVSQYVNQTTLKHRLYANQMKYKPDEFSLFTWRDTTNIMLQHPNFFMENLTIQQAKFEKQNQLVFYTNNPLDFSMTTLPARLLSAMPDGYKTFLKMKQQMINIILPDLYLSNTLVMDYQLTQPQFYISITSKKFNLFQTIFGIIIISFLTINYIVRAVLTCPHEALSQYGQILPHFSSLKAPVFIIHPLFPEEISFCLGFMTAQLPWLRQFFSQLVSDKSQTIPIQYSVLYRSMGFSSTYLLPLVVAFVLLVVMWLYKKSTSNNKKEKNTSLSQKQDENSQISKDRSWGLPEWPLKMVFYNFFFFGLCFNGSASLQNAIYNPISELTISSFLCVVGIICFVFCAVDSTYSIYKNPIFFFKMRIFSKAVFLSLCHISPIYLYSSSFLLDVVFLVLEYRISKQYKSHPRLWLYNNMMINISLALLVFVHSHMITMIISGAILLTIIAIQIYVHYQDYVTQKKRCRFMLPKGFNLNSNEQQIENKKAKMNVWDMEFSKQKEELEKNKAKQISSREPNLEDNKKQQGEADFKRKSKKRKEKKIGDSLRINYQNQSESYIESVDNENKADTFLAADFIN